MAESFLVNREGFLRRSSRNILPLWDLCISPWFSIYYPIYRTQEGFRGILFKYSPLFGGLAPYLALDPIYPSFTLF